MTKTGNPGPKSPVVVFLHGAGQEPNNDVLSRFAAGLHSEGVAAHIVSLPHETVPDAVDRIFRTVNEPVILAGHSRGGAMAFMVAQTYRAKVSAVIAINPVMNAPSMPVPTLVLRGTNDLPGSWRERTRRNVSVADVQGSDHSLRFREPWGSREEAEGSEETIRMNRVVAREIGSSLARVGQ